MTEYYRLGFNQKEGLLTQMDHPSVSYFHRKSMYSLDTEITEVSATDMHRIGEQAPVFSLLDLEGNQVNFTDYDGKTLVIHFATTWCPFCNTEAPHLEKLYQLYQDKEVEVMIIDIRGK